jgi:hypothetical protein
MGDIASIVGGHFIQKESIRARIVALMEMKRIKLPERGRIISYAVKKIKTLLRWLSSQMDAG